MENMTMENLLEKVGNMEQEQYNAQRLAQGINDNIANWLLMMFPDKKEVVNKEQEYQKLLKMMNVL
jgi:hypothetical protein